MTDRELFAAMAAVRHSTIDEEVQRMAVLYDEWMRRIDWRRGRAARGRYAKHKLRAVAAFISQTHTYFDAWDDAMATLQPMARAMIEEQFGARLREMEAKIASVALANALAPLAFFPEGDA